MESYTTNAVSKPDELELDPDSLKLIFDNIAEGIIIARSKTGNLLFANSTFCKLFKYEHKDIKSLNFSQLHPQKFNETATKEFQKAFSDSKLVTNVPCLRSDNSIFYADVRDKKIIFNNEECNLASFTDVSDRYFNEQLLAIEEKKFGLIFENASEAIFFTMPNGEVLKANPEATRLLGYSEKELKKVGRNGIIDPSDKRFNTALENRRKDKTYKGELNFVKKNGSIITCEVTSDIFYDIIGKEYSCVILKDLTEQKAKENELKRSASLLLSTFEQCPDPRWILNTDGTIFNVNQTFLTQFNSKKGDFINNYNIFNDKNIEEQGYMPKIKNVFSKGEIAQFELYYHSDYLKSIGLINTEDLIMDVTISPIKNNKGKIIFANAHFRNITEIIKAQRDLQIFAKELEQLNADKNRFIQIIAHDLKNPFNSLLGFASLLLENMQKYDRDKIKNQIKIIYDVAQNSHNLLDDLLLWSKSQSGSLPLKLTTVNIVETCQEIVADFKESANKKGIKINCVDSEKIILEADKNMVKTILRNLISNAIKFCNENGVIDIILEADYNKGQTTTSVVDNGVGIEKNILDKLWQTKSHFSTKGTGGEGGTGLGLIICKEFVEKHNGKIWAESEPGQGSKFRFTLPFFNKKQA